MSSAFGGRVGPRSPRAAGRAAERRGADTPIRPARRVVQALVERPGEPFPRSFRLLTSLSADEAGAEALLAGYRQRGKAEGCMGELMSVVNPTLSTSPGPKRHDRGRPVETPGPSVDAFACNQARLLPGAFDYQIMRALRAPARFTVSGRRIGMFASAAPRHGQLLVSQLRLLPGPAA